MLSTGLARTLTRSLTRAVGFSAGNVSAVESTEVVAVMYDASLDAIQPHEWPQNFLDLYRNEGGHVSFREGNHATSPRTLALLPRVSIPGYHIDGSQPQLSARLQPPAGGRRGGGRARVFAAHAQRMEAGGMEYAEAGAEADGMMMQHRAVEVGANTMMSMKMDAGVDESGKESNTESKPPEAVPEVQVRRNLNETAFFFPHLVPSAHDGQVTINFTAPDSLTTWKVLLFAHDTKTRAGGLVESAVTSLDLMVRPNPPRFLREGDVLRFPVRVANSLPNKVTASVTLKIFEGDENGTDLSTTWLSESKAAPLEVGGNAQNTTFWTVSVPRGPLPMTIRYVVSVSSKDTDSFDAEEGRLPVIVDKVLLTDSQPLAILADAVNSTFRMPTLLASADADPPVVHQSLTLQITANPVWCVVRLSFRRAPRPHFLCGA